MAHSLKRPDSFDENDHQFDPQLFERVALRNAEQAGNYASNDPRSAFAASDSVTAPDTDGLAPAREVEDRGSDQGWVNTVTGTSATSKRKRGPIAVIVALLFGGGFGIVALFSGPSLLLVHIEETITGNPRINTQLTSMQVRTNRLLESKFSQATSGLCTPNFAIMCKFTRPSNYLLKQLEANGITAYDKSGNVIKPSLSPLNAKPDHFTFTGSDGKASPPISADGLLIKLNSDPSFAAAFSRAYNPRFVSLSDSVFAKIKHRFGFLGADTLKDSKSDAVDKQVTDDALGTTEDANTSGGTAASSNPDQAAQEVATDVETDVEKTVSDLGKKSVRSASAVVTGASLACAASDIPEMIVKIVRGYQLAQLVRYASVFLITAGALKAGDATPTEVSALGDLLTNTDSSGKSAMDSFGMRNVLMGDSGVGTDTTWSRFSPGASIASSPFGQVASLLSGSAKTDVCNVVTNPALGTGLAIASDSNPVTAAINTLLSVGTGFALSALAQPIASFVAHAIPSQVYDAVLKAIAGDALAGLQNGGVGVGDALASGAENMMSQTANAGGNMPLKVQDAVSYNRTAGHVAAEYAAQDRATLSPLDASNPNTALGSFVNQFLPYSADLSSPSGVLSMIGSIVSSSFSSLASPLVAKAADPSYDYTQCQDPVIKDSGTAATPFCAIDYGIPPQYLGIDPTQVVQDLKDSGDIDSDGNVVPDNVVQSTASSLFGGDTASTVSSLSDWTSLCTDGSTTPITDSGDACAITNRQTAEYALYTIDHRIQQTMDGEDSYVTSGSSAPVGTEPSSSNTN